MEAGGSVLRRLGLLHAHLTGAVSTPLAPRSAAARQGSSSTCGTYSKSTRTSPDVPHPRESQIRPCVSARAAVGKVYTSDRAREGARAHTHTHSRGSRKPGRPVTTRARTALKLLQVMRGDDCARYSRRTSGSPVPDTPPLPSAPGLLRPSRSPPESTAGHRQASNPSSPRREEAAKLA